MIIELGLIALGLGLLKMGQLGYPLDQHYPLGARRFGDIWHPIELKTMFHSGVDINAPQSVAVVSVAGGQVDVVGWDSLNGNYIIIKHNFGFASSYVHLSAVNVVIGQKVKQGQLIGRVGATGLSTGPHLHFSLKLFGKFVNPENYIRF